MAYEHIKDLSAEEFRRMTGIQPSTFAKMVEILESAQAKCKREQKWKGGRTADLPVADQLLLALEYQREYRSMFHIAKSRGIGESKAWRALHWVEDTLIRDGTFSLPGKKELLRNDVEYQLVVVDATETPIERPKKGRSVFTPAKKSGTRSNGKSS